MKAWEVVGWTFEGAAYCNDHKPEVDMEPETELQPIFAVEEDWESMTCDTCHQKLEDTV